MLQKEQTEVRSRRGFLAELAEPALETLPAILLLTGLVGESRVTTVANSLGDAKVRPASLKQVRQFMMYTKASFLCCCVRRRLAEASQPCLSKKESTPRFPAEAQLSLGKLGDLRSKLKPVASDFPSHSRCPAGRLRTPKCQTWWPRLMKENIISCRSSQPRSGHQHHRQLLSARKPCASCRKYQKCFSAKQQNVALDYLMRSCEYCCCFSACRTVDFLRGHAAAD